MYVLVNYMRIRIKTHEASARYVECNVNRIKRLNGTFNILAMPWLSVIIPEEVSEVLRCVFCFRCNENEQQDGQTHSINKLLDWRDPL